VPDFRKRVVTNCVQVKSEGIVGFDIRKCYQHLLLYEDLVLKSGRLADLGHLVRQLGLETALDVIRADGVRILCQPYALARAGEPQVLDKRHGDVQLNHLDYCIVEYGHSHNEWVESGFAEAFRIAGLTAGKARKFENVVRSKLIPERAAPLAEALASARADLLTGSVSVREAIRLSLWRKVGVGLPEIGTYTLNVDFVQGHGFSVSTNLPRVLTLPPASIAEVLNEGFLGAVGIHGLLDDMRTHAAMIDMQTDELPVLEARLANTARQYSSDEQDRRYTRVVDVLQLPDFTCEADALRADTKKLLEVRASEECRRFREWLFTAVDISDTELADMFTALRPRLGALVRSGPCKAIRWAFGNGVSLIPVAGPLLGAAIGAVDTFLLESVLPSRGPLAFLDNQYPSIFKS
jgi:hypothetical protein